MISINLQGEALEVLNKVLSFDQVDTFTVKALIQKGNALSYLHKYPEALQAFKEARKVSWGFENNQLIARTDWGVGVGFYYLQAYDSAIHYLSNALKYYESTNDVETQVSLINNIAVFYTKLNQQEKADSVYQRLFLLAQGLDNSDYLLQIVLNRITDLYDSADYSKAQFYSQQFLKLLSDSSDFDLIKPYRYLALTHYQLGDQKTSSHYFYKYDSMASHLLNKDYNDKILELETQFKTAEIEKDNALKQLQIEQQQQAQLIMGGLIVFLILGAVGLYIYNEQRKRTLLAIATKDKQLYDQQIEELLNEEEIKTTYALLDGQDKERKRIAQELHDNISSTMATLNMFLSSFNPSKLDQKEQDLLQRINEVAFQTAEDTRSLSHSLDSGALSHFGLSVAVNDLLEAVAKSGLTIDSSINLENSLPGDLAMNTYRIIQELVNNTLKHAQAKSINLEINEIADEYLSVIYSDDGVGFDSTSASEGIGLKNIRSRVDALNAQLTIDSKTKQHTTFILEIPLT